MSKQYTYETLQAMAADIQVMNNILQIAFDNVNTGLEAAKEGDLDLAHTKIVEVSKILEKVSSTFTKTFVKHKHSVEN
jgi:hypothetical protein